MAEQGNASAQHYMGIMYDTGYGVVKNVETAIKWFVLAAYNGDDEGAEKTAALGKTMTAVQIIKSQEMANRCLESIYTDC